MKAGTLLVVVPVFHVITPAYNNTDGTLHQRTTSLNFYFLYVESNEIPKYFFESNVHAA